MALPSTPSLQLGGGVQVLNPTPLDVYEGPYASVAAANAAVPSALRSISGTTGLLAGRTVIIDNGTIRQAYWWDGGILDSNLIIKVAPLIANTPATNITPVVAGDVYQTVVDKLQSQISNVSILQVETQSYLTRAIATGAHLDNNTISAIDSFIIKGKADGWLSKLLFAYAPFSTTLAGAMHNIYAATGFPSAWTNNNFVDADYDPALGLGTGASANTNKFLGSGYSPNTFGLTKSNVALGIHVPKYYAGYGTGFFLGLNPVSSIIPLYIGNAVTGIIIYSEGANGGVATNSTSLPNIITYSSGPSRQVNGYTNGINSLDSTTTAQDSVALDSEVTLFKARYSGTDFFCKSKISFCFMASFLTKIENKSLSLAIRSLMISTGRINNGGGLLGFFGDSITVGAGSTSPDKKYSSIMSRGLGLKEFNGARGESSLRLTTSTGSPSAYGVTGGYQKYLDYESIDINTMVCMYGTNDMALDSTTDGDATLIADFTAKLTTIVQYWIDKNFAVIIMSPPYRDSFTATKITAYGMACYNVANNLGVTFVDTYTLFTDTGAPSTYLSDGTHPNDAGHKLIATLATSAFNGRIYRLLAIDFPNISPNGYADITVSMLGAKINMATYLGEFSTNNAGIVFESFVSSENVVTVRAKNISLLAIDLPSMYMRVVVVLK